MSDETRDLAQRIETALKRRAETDADGFAAMTVAQKALDRWRKRMAEGREAPMGEVYLYDIIRSLIGTVQALRATDDALLLDALARIEALREALAEAFDLYWRGVHMAEDRGYSGDNVDADLDARLRRNGDRIRELGALVGRDITALAHLNYVTAGGNDDDAR